MVEILLLLMSTGFLMLRLGGTGSFPKPLKPEEEERYVRQWVEHGDLEARNILVERNLRLVAHVMKKYYTAGADMDDLISIGTIGLIKAVNTYRPDKNVRLATYASRCVENEVLMHFRSMRKSAGDMSLSDSMELDDEGGSLSLMDVLCCEDEALERVGYLQLLQQVRESVDVLLDEKEREVIYYRYGLNGTAPLTQRETGRRMRISRSYVSRIEKRALEKLQHYFDESI